jgi:hypothetical protein
MASPSILLTRLNNPAENPPPILKLLAVLEVALSLTPESALSVECTRSIRLGRYEYAPEE